MNLPLAPALAVLISACSSVTMMGGSDVPVSEAACDVRVYQTQAQALKQGPIDELCTIEGTSAPGFDHSVPAAIAKHKGKACGCGATGVYVQSRSQPGIFSGPATVSMVAFRYASSAPPKTTAGIPPAPQAAPVSAKPADAALATDAEAAKVVQVLADTGFPLVGQPVRFKQKGNVTLYEARGTGGRLTQVACESGACGVRTIHD